MVMVTKRAGIVCIGCVTMLSASGLVHAQVVNPSTLTNKVVCGYQGWFSCPGDGGDSYSHWSQAGDDIGPDLYHIDMWPDVSEFDPEELFLCPNVTLLDDSIGQ